MDITDLDNTPRTMTIGNKELKVVRLSLKELFVEMEALVKDEYFTNVRDIAKTLEGKDRISFLTQATKDVPKGDELNGMVQAELTTLKGISKLLFMSLSKHNKLSKEDVDSLITNDNMEEIRLMLEFICGSDTLTEENKKKLP